MSVISKSISNYSTSTSALWSASSLYLSNSKSSKRNRTKNGSILPYAVGDGAVHTMHVCAFWPRSSLLKPDPRQLQQLLPFSDLGRVTKEVPIQTYRLDDIEEISALDFLKIDIQGFEVTVFQNGRNKLKQAVCLQLELPFTKHYHITRPLVQFT